MRLLRIAVVACMACGSPPNVGHECGVTDPSCDESLTCNSMILGGYCTAVCTMPGSTSQCPDGSICDTVSNIGAMCVKLCNDVSDCGRDNLDCTGVAMSNSKACKP